MGMTPLKHERRCGDVGILENFRKNEGPDHRGVGPRRKKSGKRRPAAENLDEARAWEDGTRPVVVIVQVPRNEIIR